MRGDYRKDIELQIVQAELDDVEKTDFLMFEDVKTMFDGIETKVNEILAMVCIIKGITEIDEIKEQLEKLSDDLY